MQLHHIVAEADGGADTSENCIPLCLECHEEVGSYNPAHPIGRKFTEQELKQHRDVWFDFVKSHPERLTYSSDSLFRPNPGVASPTPEILATVEPYYHEVVVWSKEKGDQRKEVFSAKVRNQGTRAIYVDIIGVTAGTRKYPGLFSSYSAKNQDEASEILPGRTQVFTCFGVKIEEYDIPKLDGMYLVTGTGHEFINRELNLGRLIQEWQNERT